MKALLPLFLYLPTMVFACYCGSSTIEEKVKNSDFIYVGVIIESRMDSHKVIHNFLKIKELIKGNPESLSFTNETLQTSLCAQSTSVGMRYVVFGNYDSPTRLSSCTRTQALYVYGVEGLKSIKEAANNQLNSTPHSGAN